MAPIASLLVTGAKVEQGCHFLKDKSRFYMRAVVGHIAVYLGASLWQDIKAGVFERAPGRYLVIKEAKDILMFCHDSKQTKSQ